MSTPESQQPKPGWEWYHPTTISGLPHHPAKEDIKIIIIILVRNKVRMLDNNYKSHLQTRTHPQSKHDSIELHATLASYIVTGGDRVEQYY